MKPWKNGGRDMSMVSNRQGPKSVPPRFNRLVVMLSSLASFACSSVSELNRPSYGFFAGIEMHPRNPGNPVG
jgi:hypothetical protein